MSERVCKSCGYVGKAEHQSWGTLFSGLLFVLAIPMAWTIYHLALFANTQCPKCESLDMVSKNSKKGKAVLEHAAGCPAPWHEDSQAAHSH